MEIGKKKAQEKAEADFRALLDSRAGEIPILPDSLWADVKKHLSSDPRYDAVGSSSLREELFTAWLAGRTAPPPPTSPPAAGAEEGKAPKHESKLERQQRALRERESQVRREKDRLDREVERSRGQVSLEEGEREFGSLLVDAVREVDVRPFPSFPLPFLH